MRFSLSLACAPGSVQGQFRCVRYGTPGTQLRGPAVWLLALAGVLLLSGGQELWAQVGGRSKADADTTWQVFGPRGHVPDEAAERAFQPPRRRTQITRTPMDSMQLSWAAPGDLARVAATLDNIGRQRISLHWVLAARGARKLLIEQPLELSFTPTVVTRRGPRDDRLYVAGWMADERKLVIEEWRLAPVEMSWAVSADGVRRTQLSPALPEVRRRQIFLSYAHEKMRPLSGLACDADGDRLWLLPEGPASGLSIFDLGTGRMVVAPDLTAITGDVADRSPPMPGQHAVDGDTHSVVVHLDDWHSQATMRWIRLGRHRWEGTVFVLQARLPWEVPRPSSPFQGKLCAELGHTLGHEAADQFLVLTDTDRDGRVDRIEAMGPVQFGEAYSSDGWLNSYAEGRSGR